MVIGLRLSTLVFIRLNPTNTFCNINDFVVSRKPRILQKYDIPAIHALTVLDENCLNERYATKWIKSLGFGGQV